jgi:hypothetical protein
MLQKFSLNIEPEALIDIQEAINYYNSIQKGIGKEILYCD